VNAANATQSISIALDGIKSVASTASGLVLTGNPRDQNFISAPLTVIPRPLQITNISPTFTYSAPANSVSVLNLTHVVLKDHQ
jgi:alpha-L-arabinofuranosidase